MINSNICNSEFLIKSYKLVLFSFLVFCISVRKVNLGSASVISSRATDEGSLPETTQYSPYYLSLNVLLLPKDQTFIFYLLLLKLVLCRVAAVKSLPVQHP